MTVQKFIKYNSLDINGQVLNDEHKLELNVLEKSGNSLIHKDILRHNLLNRQGTVSTKTRSEVRGGGRKPWRQKGTGRARAGSNRSPLWKGGGVIFGPKPKTRNYKLNQKERNLALQTLMYNHRENISIIDDEILEISKTKEFIALLKKYNFSIDKKLLVVVSKKPKNLFLALRNLKNVELILASNLNTLSLLKASDILITVPALNNIKEIYCD
jgi:large subunit ribosomal protein L4